MVADTLLKQLVADAGLSKARHMILSCKGFDRPLCAMKVDHSNSVERWRAFRALHPASGYWPLIVTYIPNGQPPPWSEIAEEETQNLFSRFFFEEEAGPGGKGAKSSSPGAILEASQTAEVTYALEAAQLGFAEDVSSEAGWRLDRLLQEYGDAPERDQFVRSVSASDRPTWLALEQEIFAWRLSKGVRPKQPGKQYWYEPTSPLALLLLPIENGFEALAHMHWWGSFQLGTPATIALMRSWNLQHGVELMCHYGTILHLDVPTPITEPLIAFDVAAAKETICMQELPSEAAWQLLGATHWHLHSRP